MKVILRIEHIDMDIQWLGLPKDRVKAAQRAAAHCMLRNTLEQPPEVSTQVWV